MLKQFIYELPKAELHVHIEGTMEPEQMFLFADRNKVRLPYQSPEEARYAYQCYDYASFLKAYLKAAQVLCTEQDFYELTAAYLTKAHQQGVKHAEIFFDFQTYQSRGVSDAVIVEGIYWACVEAGKKYGMTTGLILCLIRDFSAVDAEQTLYKARIFKDKIIGIGLASTEAGNPPRKFQRVFEQARNEGYHCVAHAGERNHLDYIVEALHLLRVERIDHGIHCLEDKVLVAELVSKHIGLTVCPLSNVVLGIVRRLEEHPLKKMLNAGLIVSINSDDPAFFGGYIADNYYAVAEALNFSIDDIVQCARNSFRSSFLDNKQKESYIKKLEKYVATYQWEI